MVSLAAMNACVNEFKVDNELRALESGIHAIENGVVHTITTRDTVNIEGIEQQVAEVEKDLGMLQKINDDDSSVKFIDQLDALVRQKLALSHQVLNTFHQTGRPAAEAAFCYTGKPAANAGYCSYRP